MENTLKLDFTKLHEEDEKLFDEAKKYDNLNMYFEKQIDRVQNAVHKHILMTYLLMRKDNCFDHVEKPTSSSGKYHPVYQNTRCGNGKHIKNVVHVIDVFKRAFPKGIDWDAVYTAAILHDLSKYDKNFKYTIPNHGDIEADKFIEAVNGIIKTHYKKARLSLKLFFEKRKIIKWVKLVEHLIRWHDGRFNPKNAKSKSDIENEVVDTFYKEGKYVETYFIHLADMISANKVLAEAPF